MGHGDRLILYYKNMLIEDLKVLMDTLPKEIRREIWEMCVGYILTLDVFKYNMGFVQKYHAMKELKYSDPIKYKMIAPLLPLEVILILIRNGGLVEVVSYEVLLDIMNRSRFMLLRYVNELSVTIFYNTFEIYGMPISGRGQIIGASVNGYDAIYTIEFHHTVFLRHSKS